ncbi:hypothetical protein Pla110_44120 [Polystyrenella longa]|uniref:Uncharacterized protein n=1 Tax=Polystyrenella longa TaxID=2528007 RepID=A0A518CTT9_9PLAN|nr:hypothetical protein [Polystyrenella longa]QDU82651.1 hypothetical protein Pla110_44120 [Polystyrenella longa]
MTIKRMTRNGLVKSDFPKGEPVRFEAIIDSGCGWEFDAPLHFCKPFHRYCIVTSVCNATIEDRIERFMIDLDIHGYVEGDHDTWPYDNAQYIKGLFYRARKAKVRRGVSYFACDVIVRKWGNEDECVEYDVEWVATNDDE